MNKTVRQNLEALLAILLFPQLFVFLYYLFPIMKGPSSFGLIKQVLLLGLGISQLAGSILYLLYWAIATLNQEQRHAGTSFLLCLFTGYLGLIVWNKLIFENFSYTWGLIPLLLCSAGVGLYHFFKTKSYLELKSYLAPRKPELFLSPDA